MSHFSVSPECSELYQACSRIQLGGGLASFLNHSTRFRRGHIGQLLEFLDRIHLMRFASLHDITPDNAGSCRGGGRILEKKERACANWAGSGQNLNLELISGRETGRSGGCCWFLHREI